MKSINLLGASGSIGTQTLDVIREHPSEFTLNAFAVGQNIEAAHQIIQEFHPKAVSVSKKNDAEQLKWEYPSIKCTYGDEGLIEIATYPGGDLVLNAVTGSLGLKPTLEAIKLGKTIAIANKETLVTAGHIVIEEAKKYGVMLLPVDSEHSAIFQCLQGEHKKNIDKLIITASGGSFRDRSRNELKGVSVEQALNHPNWSMGAKVTIDSATMMNKGLEVIEAHWLFGIPYEKIEVLLHKESIIHSMIEFHDSSVMAQLGTPDMRVPIQYALSYPDRLPLTKAKRLNLSEIGKLHFQPMDLERFKALKFAFEAGKMGGSMTTVLNAANEIAVQAFLDKQITFLEIDELVERALLNHTPVSHPDLDTILQIDKETREWVRSLLPR
ncbi:MAG TPA: 1-deoxy-D-xylulose-5-phosphate reductoisomerase [Bacillus sp. (in: firmicutes)]|uniref:1-deoxy-D-xylulose-5-phosphate reductoisomerase n=1 Tax=Bacillus litorisediminis TaxID=2922713 RepID=UPI001FAB9D3A|nr:1-deoxy-D-xylulose-5-phosphate reductoisomerase [Bacillus litorisediminis]HWO77990.1 1-deoxy-D-xylulose-5-phosphate reductoisomerase [Bacillus sp. (in: firmicutes)]